MSQVPDAVEPQPDPFDLPPMPEDRYREFEVIGVGGMGVVYSALDNSLQRRVAFKVMKSPVLARTPADLLPATPADLPPFPADGPHAAGRLTAEARFLQEPILTGRLEHPGIVPVHEIGRTPRGLPYYTMRLIRGHRTLREHLASFLGWPVEGRLGLLDVFLHVCDAVQFAHEHAILHRDLKPANVAIGPHGEVVVLDLGLAKLIGAADDSLQRLDGELSAMREAVDYDETFGFVGSPGYMAPEAASGDVDRITVRSDVYGLAAILFEMLTGRTPILRPVGHGVEALREFQKELATEERPRADTIDPDVPRGLADLCAHGLTIAPGARIESVAALADAVRGWKARYAARLRATLLLEEAERHLEAPDGDEDAAACLARCQRARGLLDRALEQDADVVGADALRARVEARAAAAVATQGRHASRRLVRGLALMIGILIVLAGGALYLAEVQRSYRADAEAARHGERRARVLAEDVLEWIAAETPGALEAAGNTEAVTRLSARLGTYFENDAITPTSREAAIRHARLLFPHGYQLAMGAEPAAAVPYFRRALAMVRPFREGAAPESLIHLAEARLHIGLGIAHAAVGERRGAADAYRAAVAAARVGLGTANESKAVHQAMWALRELAVLLAPAHAQASVAALHESLQFVQRLDPEKDTNPESRHIVPRFEAALHQDLADAHLQAGRVGEAEQALQRAHAILTALREAWPQTHASIEESFARVASALGILKVRQGDLEGALAQLRMATPLLAPQFARSPADPEALRTTLLTLLALAHAEALAGNVRVATEHTAQVADVLADSGMSRRFLITRALALALRATVAPAADAPGLREQVRHLQSPAALGSDVSTVLRTARRRDLAACARLLRDLAARPGATAALLELREGIHAQYQALVAADPDLLAD